ncbi:MAG TPA: polyprenyl diphosphate synthase [Candidatus Pacearchaeota archaeon]|nr:polyprenyl diphosphate synthase [Candidatus Pacearchaeota archaeon]
MPKQILPKITNLPNHIAIIPDGNRRWARQRKMQPWMGHYHGFRAVEDIFETAFNLGISHFSIWVASRDNILKRDKKEVDFLLKLFEQKFNILATHKMITKMRVKVRVLGDWEELCPIGVRKAIKKAIEATKNYNNFHLTFYLGYSGTKEMIDCVKAIIRKADKNAGIDECLIKNNLYTHELPPVDLVIRTGGEPHNSDGFMMWDVANAQYIFSKKYWPDFKGPELIKALKAYARRERRMGA